jgi:ABC-2 type transport system permease protein
MRAVGLNVLMQVRQLWREWGYMFGTMVVPSLFFLFFALPNATDASRANLLLGSFSCFALLGVVFLFGPRIARDRASSWTRYLFTLPVTPWATFCGYAVCVLLTSLLAVWFMQVVIVATAPQDLSARQWLELNLVVIGGGAPFIVLAVLIGLATSENLSVPVTNAFYLILSYLGGLWIPPNALPKSIQKVSSWTPTRHYGELAWAVVRDESLPARSVGVLTAYLAIFGLLVLLCLQARKSDQ